MQLRDYQSAACESIFTYFRKSMGNPIVALPTGTGKSVIIADFAKSACTQYPNTRIMMLTHVKELIEQNFEKLITLWPTAPAGIYSAGLNRRETHCNITFAGIGSVAKRAQEFGHIDLILIDECHLVSSNENTMYRKFIADLKETNPFLKVIGLTATPYRMGSGLLIEDEMFDDYCFDMTDMASFNWLLEQGYLAPLVPKQTLNEIDVSSVKIRGGEFVLKDLQDAVDQDHLTEAAIKEMLELGHDRKHWLIFAAGIEHAHHVADMLEQFGITTGVVHSKLNKAERENVLKRFKSGEIRAVVNNNVLTTGFDHPGIDLIGVIRHTCSPGLWVQMLGRGTRPVFADGFDLTTAEGRLAAQAEGPKQDCLVLDFAGNTRRLGPINDPVVPRRKGKGGGGTAPVRVCDKCNTYMHASLRACTECGYEFPIKSKLEMEASSTALIATAEPQVETFKVDVVTYDIHRKKDRPSSMKVTYFCGIRKFSEWICFEHTGYAKKKAHDWWRERCITEPTIEPPETSQRAVDLSSKLDMPVSIHVWINKKHPEITGYDLIPF